MKHGLIDKIKTNTFLALNLNDYLIVTFHDSFM